MTRSQNRSSESETLRAVGYCRVSSIAQRDRDTIASQIRTIPEFITAHGWKLVKSIDTYVDDGRTAKAGHLEARTGLAALLRDAALKLFDVVVVVDLDRLTRSEDIAERGMILGALQRANVRVASAMSGEVLDLSSSMGDLLAGLKGFFAAEDNRKRRERTLQGRISSVQRGHKPAGKLPYGLAYDKTTATWSLDPVKAPWVRQLIERVAAGESCRAVSDDFHKRGAPRPRGEWNRSRAQRIVRSRYAVGEWLVDKHLKLTIAVPPIVDEDTWHRAQATMAVSGRRGLRKTKHDYLLESLGVCGECGAPMGIRSAVYDPRRNGRWSPAVYQCRGRRLFRKGGAQCTAKHVQTQDADDRVWNAISTQLADPKLASRISGELEGRASEAEQWRKDAEGYRTHLARLERVEVAMLERYSDGDISDGAFKVECKRLRKERDVIKAQLATAERAQKARTSDKVKIDDARKLVTEMRAMMADVSFAVRRRLVELLVQPGGIVFVGERVKVTLFVPRLSVASRPVLVERSASDTR